jgi:hypothetical protein
VASKSIGTILRDHFAGFGIEEVGGGPVGPTTRSYAIKIGGGSDSGTGAPAGPAAGPTLGTLPRGLRERIEQLSADLGISPDDFLRRARKHHLTPQQAVALLTTR